MESKAMNRDPLEHDYLYIYRIPVHSEFTWFHGIRCREPHDSIISGGVYYNDFVTAATVYLNDLWEGQRPTLIARDKHLNELWRWEKTLPPVVPSTDLPF